MSLIAVFPDPPASGDVTLCEYNTQYVSEDFERADLKKHVPATHVSFAPFTWKLFHFFLTLWLVKLVFLFLYNLFMCVLCIYVSLFSAGA